MYYTVIKQRGDTSYRPSPSPRPMDLAPVLDLCTSLSFTGGGAEGICPPSPPPRNLFANMHTTITLYVPPPQSLSNSRFAPPPSTNFLNETLLNITYLKVTIVCAYLI